MRTSGNAIKGQTITFSEVRGNVGSSFNKDTGEFKVEVPGLYFLTISATTRNHNYFTVINLVKNGSNEFQTWHQNEDSSNKTYENLSSSIMIQLSVGDVIKLNLSANDLSSPFIFTGQLVLADE